MNKKYTKEKVFELAKQYKYKSDFKKNNPSAYQAARRNIWLGEMVWFQRKKNPYVDKLDNVYCYKFEDLHYIYVGRTIYPKTRNWEHRNHSNSSVYNFAKEHGIEIPEMEILESGLTLEDGLKLEDFYVNKFRNEGWNILNKAKTGVGSGSLGGGIKIWSKDKVFETAKKYKYKMDFRKNGGAYRAALINNWLTGMDWFERPKTTCEKTVLQYNLNGEFIKEWPSAVEIEKQLGYKRSCIGQCCLGKNKTSYGFIWKYKDKIQNLFQQRIHNKIIYQYNLNNEFIKEWSSVAEIEKQLGYKKGCIYQCCRGDKKTAYGYIWRYEKMEGTN